MTDDIDGDPIPDRDHTVLQCIHEGKNNTRQIREATTISNHNVNHALDRLEDRDFITTHTPDGRVTEVVDGQKRNFKAPRHAEITDRGQDFLTQTDREHPMHRDMTHEELVEQVHDLNHRVEELEAAFEAFRQQVLRKLE